MHTWICTWSHNCDIVLPQAVLGEPQLIYWHRTSRTGRAHRGRHWSARWLHGRSHESACLEGDLGWREDTDVSQEWGILNLHPHLAASRFWHCLSYAGPLPSEVKEKKQIQYGTTGTEPPNCSFPCSVCWQMLFGSCQNENKPTIEPSLKITGKMHWAERQLAKLSLRWQHGRGA